MPLHRRILLPVHSDVPSPPSSPLLASHHQLPTNVIIAAASAVAAFLFLSLIYYSILRRRRRPLPSSSSSVGGSLAFSPSSADHPFWHMKTVGLDDVTIDSLPSHAHSGAADADCHVCLDEITDGEVVRLLPTCGHVFHVHCIDTWLRSHLTCPLCRATVVTLEPAGGNADDSSALSEDGGDDEGDEARFEEGQSSAVTLRSVSMDSAVMGGFIFRGEGEEKEGNSSNFSNLSKEEVSEKGQSVSGKNLWLPRLGRARSSSVLPL